MANMLSGTGILNSASPAALKGMPKAGKPMKKPAKGKGAKAPKGAKVPNPKSPMASQDTSGPGAVGNFKIDKLGIT